MRQAIAIGGITFALAGYANSQLPMGINLRSASDFGLSMTGGGTQMWSDADEKISLRAQLAANATISQAKSRDREGNLALAAACGLSAKEPAVKRAANLSDYASIMRMNLAHNATKADAPGLSRVSMVAMNRLEGYSQGYETGAREAFVMVFTADPAVKKRVCAAVAEMIRP